MWDADLQWRPSLTRTLRLRLELIGCFIAPQTHCRWVMELRGARGLRRVGRPKIARKLRELVTRLTKKHAGWGYRRTMGDRRIRRLREFARIELTLQSPELAVRPDVARAACAQAGDGPVAPSRRHRSVNETTWRDCG
jgi:hypothetical protein